MKKVLFITEKDALHGFQLAGAGQVTATEADDVGSVLWRAMEEPDVGLIAIEERLVGKIGDKALRDMENRWGGILVVLPSPEKPGVVAEDYALALIKRAIGYHVRLKP